MTQKRRVAEVKFPDYESPTHSGRPQTKSYEYALPEGSPEAPTHGVVVVSPKEGASLASMKIVKILKIKDSEEQVYDGELKELVVAFDLAVHEANVARYRRRKELLGRAHKMVAELGVVAQLEMLLTKMPENEEMSSLLAELRSTKYSGVKE